MYRPANANLNNLLLLLIRSSIFLDMLCVHTPPARLLAARSWLDYEFRTHPPSPSSVDITLIDSAHPLEIFYPHK